ncbi:unnamed protein product [Lota lota]
MAAVRLWKGAGCADVHYAPQPAHLGPERREAEFLSTGGGVAADDAWSVAPVPSTLDTAVGLAASLRTG